MSANSQRSPFDRMETSDVSDRQWERRDTPVHSGPTRRGAQGTRSQHDKRSGSESNAS